MNNNNKIFSPSLNYERKTKALNKEVWGFVGLISMFTIPLLGVIFHEMICSVFNIVSSVISSNSILFTVIPIIISATMFGIGFYKYIMILLNSYKFEDNKIIKGRLININNKNFASLAVDASTVAYMANNLNNSNNVMTTKTASELNDLFNLIKLNCNDEFAKQNFDTDAYKKTIYNNPKLIKETKSQYIYKCDNNKTLKIPKIYEHMNNSQKNQKESSITERVIIRSLIVLLIFTLFSFTDLIIGASNNQKNISVMTNSYSSIEKQLTEYGYTGVKSNENHYYFKKKVSDLRSSYISYEFDINGNVKNVEMNLFYDNTYTLELELKPIIKSLNDNFTDTEIDAFIAKAQSCINENCSFDKLVSQKNTIRIGTSNSMIEIHN